MTKLRKKKLKLKQSQRIKTLVLVTGLLICCCIVSTLLVIINKAAPIEFEIESRIKTIEKEKKKDKKELGYETGVHPVGDYVAVKVPVFSLKN